ncbi:AAA family ATPase [Nonomuraea indica]|uniref:AAA family ATPase n=1 Tax=Nonomuraea indica TaxID=1581193 RepID=UPI000C7A2CFD|nr:AAA family ATPase [Nonomuraea indica]
MRPHRLTLTAFGSFPGTESVDFDALAEAGLFLVHGPTGAGKTTVLDALCFALYGQVPGQRNSARALRCDHAPPTTGPAATLEVSIRGRTLRIRRSPAWQRPKLRGTGFTEEKAKVIVEERSGDGWRALTTRSDEAGDLVGGLLGMNADQFCQVAMLPQGDFARFLRADGDDRRRLLERLFTVKVFTQTESWLAEHRKQLWREQSELRQQVDYAVQRVEEAAGPDLLATLTAPAPPTGPVEAPPTGPAVPETVPSGTTAPPAITPDPIARDATTFDAIARDAVTRDLITRDLIARDATTSDAIARDAVTRDLITRDLIARDATPSDAIARDAVTRDLITRDLIARDATTSDPIAPDPITPDTDPLRWAGALLDAARAAVTRTTRLHAEAEDTLRRAGTRFEQSAALAERQRRHAEALTRRRTLDERADERADLQAVLDEAARADRVLPLVSAARQRAETAAKARTLAADAVARARPLLTAPAPPRPSAGEAPGAGAGSAEPERLAAMERQRQAEIARLSELLTEEARLLVVRRDLGRAEEELAGLADQEEEATARLAALPALIEHAEAELARARLDAARIPAAEAVRTAAAELIGVDRELARLERELGRQAEREAELSAAEAELPARLADVQHRLAATRAEAAALPATAAELDAAAALRDAARRRDALAAELEAAAATHQACVDRAQTLRERWLDVRQARIDGMAAELARDLADGEPCAVCGSHDHPHPASPAPSAPSPGDERAAESAHEKALAEREAAERALAALRSRHDDAMAATDGLDAQAAEAAVESARQELARLRAVAATEPALAAEAERIEAERERLRDRARELGETRAAHRAHRTRLLSERTRLVTRLAHSDLPLPAGGPPSPAPHADPGSPLAWSPSGEDSPLPDPHAGHDSRPDSQSTLPTAVPPASPFPADSGLAVSPGSPFPADSGLAPGSPIAADSGLDVPSASSIPAEAGPDVLEAAEREVARLRACAAAEPALAAEAARLAHERTVLEERARRITARLAACRTRQEELSGDAGRLTARLDSARGDDATLAARLSRLSDEAELLREALEATRRAVAAEEERVRAEEAAEQAAREAGFADAAEAADAARTPAEQESKAELLRALDAEHAAVTGMLRDPELVAAAAEPAPDLAAMREQRDEADRARTALASARDRASARERRLRELHDELAACIDRWRPAADRHRLAESIAALASGTSSDNQWSMSLSSFVLGERLRQVVDAANERLDHMSAGRYLLQHDLRKTAGSRGRSGGGLGLRISDGWTGVDRDPATLSGGESFITSLALALGLADVVTAEAGGAEIGTLFVDEGFGTLDEDTLDGVLDILDGLRDGGRAVGIVSHVAELRSRIPAQLKVTKTRTGSTLATLGTG